MTTQRSAEAVAYHRLYNLKPWVRRRAAQISAHPLCQWCMDRGLLVPATIAHHAEPHKGDWLKFIQGPLVSPCKPCHDSLGQSEDKLGYSKGCDASGAPVDAEHHWNVVKPG